MANKFEKGPKIPTREEILERIGLHAEHTTILRELADSEGICLLETKVGSENPNEDIRYEYRREGTFPNHNSSLETTIYHIEYKDGIPVWGVNVETFDAATGEWKEIK